jgi:hypothetical protein
MGSRGLDISVISKYRMITISHQSGHDRPVSPSSNSPFKTLPNPLRPFALQFSTIFPILLSILLHVVANLICIFLVSRQLVLLSALPKFLHFFCDQKWCTGGSYEKCHLGRFQSLLILFSNGSNFAFIYQNGYNQHFYS